MSIVSAGEFDIGTRSIPYCEMPRHHQNDPTNSAGYYFWLLMYYSKSLTTTSPITRSATEKIDRAVNASRPIRRSHLAIDCPGNPYASMRKPIKNPAIQRMN
jgi:hypothetical protein